MPQNNNDPAQGEETLRQLCAHLERLEQRANLSDAERDTLRKAGAAFHVVYLHGLMNELDQFINPQQLTTEQEGHLRSLGIDPDE